VEIRELAFTSGTKRLLLAAGENK